MFAKEIYIQRRAELKQRMGEGLILLFGNNDSPNNYPGNTYRFRQDSCFLYFFGQKREGLVGVIDVDNDKEYIFGDDIDIDDIARFIAKEAKKNNIGEYDPEELFFIVEGELAYNGVIDDED